ncbi:AAA family ATPase [Archangium lansingense]|uniref:AAA family ATPase n=1 Tax=Archangium lansingense TaxID=2995310 RepID=A0ABT3ZU76_9BACT|nr:adenylate/guanylate cyclase domain-containing protein [Archangium lansinium]MCY1072942.1 AAA family ATPase [Archangium lansinium]
MNFPSRLHALAAFLPGSLVRALQEDTSRPRAGALREQQGAVLFADLTGFTAMAEALENSGPSGAERLRGILDTFFSRLIDTILAHGGDILRFAGDALVALWPADPDGELPRAVRLAAQCARAAQSLIEGSEPVDGVRLRLKVGIGAGTVRLSDVGGEKGRWDFLASGEPLLEMAQAAHSAQPGEIILGPRAWPLLHEAQGKPRGNAGWKLVAMEPVPLSDVRPPEPVTPELAPALCAYLPRVVTHRLEAGHGQWLSEFRTVTVMFINLDEPGFAAGQRPEELQRALCTLQSVLFRYGGSANQVVVDDKGVIMVAAFGLPPLSHEDDAARAAQTALDLRGPLKALGVPYRLGLATGRVFCGTTGGATRREYVMVGHTVNLAARLMQAAVGDVLCDATTLRQASSRLRFETLAPLKMRGITHPVPVFRPEQGTESAEAPGPSTRLVGRQEERSRLASAVRALAERGVGGTLLLEGEAGMGKSVLVGEMIERARAAGLNTALGLGSSVEGSPVWHVWRAVLSRLLGLEGLPDEATRTTRLMERLSAWPEQEAWAPLLNGVLPVQVPENEAVRHMTAALRAATTRELLVQLLDDCTRERPRLVVLDDAHWMDSASWELALAVQRRVKRLLLVLSTRPPGESAPAEYRQLRDSPGTAHLPLGRMSYDDVLTLVCQRLGVRNLPAQAATFIRDRAEGHPLFSEELTCALRDAGYLVIERGECRLGARSLEKLAMELPGTIQGLITSRIDRLTQQQQLTLKVASVLGRAFSFELLRDVHPVEADRPTLPQQLAELERLDLVQREDSGSGPVYAFKHVLIQEAAYHLMAFAQRRELHRAVALLHERDQEERGEQLQPLLAHHWRLAEQPERALEHLERAAEAAVSRGAHAETVALLKRALGLAASGAEPMDTMREARWSARLGAAYHALGETEHSLRHCDSALRLLGQTRPGTRAGWGGRLAREVVRHVGRMLLGRWLPAPRSEEERERLSLAASIFSTLSEQTFYAGQMLEHFTANFAAVNLAETARDFSTATAAYNSLGYMAGLGRMDGLARRYFRRVSASVDARNPPTDIVEGALHLTFGRWEEGLRLAEQGIAGARRHNNPFTLCTGLEVLGMGLELAREPGAAQYVRESMLAVANDVSNVINVLWALTEMTPTLLLLARLEEAAERLREAEVLLALADPLNVLRFRCNAALVAQRQGEHARVLVHAREALRLLRQRPLLVWSDLTSLTSLVQACLELWETARGAGDSEPRALAIASLRVLRKVSRLHPTARSRTARLEGTRAWLEGRPERAQVLWQRALELARTWRMPTDEGLAHYELARTSALGGTRALHLSRARHIFEHLGAKGPLQALDALEAPLLPAPAKASAL